MASIYKRTTAKGECRYVVRYRDQGRPAEEHFRTFDQARALKRELEHAEDRGVAVNRRASKEHLQSYAERWIRSRLVRGRPLSPRTVELYESELRCHLNPTFGSTPLLGIRPDVVRNWYAALVTTKGPTTAAKCYRLLRAILATAVGDGILGTNPAAIRGAGQEHAPERPMVTAKQVEALSQAVEPRHRAMPLLAAWCSLRLGEILALRRDRVDLMHRTVTVTEAAYELAEGGRAVSRPKSDAGERVVSIPPHVVPALDELLSTWVGPEADAWLFTGEKGGPLRRSVWRKEWDTARDACGLGHVHLHDLRHAGGTWTARTGATTKEIMARLGHASPRAALIYQHATAERDRRIADRLAAAAEEEPGAPVVELPEASSIAERGRPRGGRVAGGRPRRRRRVAVGS